LKQRFLKITSQFAVQDAALHAYKYSLYNMDHNMSHRKQTLEVLFDSCELFGSHPVHRNQDRHPTNKQQGLCELLRLKLAEPSLLLCIACSGLFAFSVRLLSCCWL
jgi:hypothetical protein